MAPRYLVTNLFGMYGTSQSKGSLAVQYNELHEDNLGILNGNLGDKIKDIKVPTLILHGSNDIFILPTDSDEMAKVIPNSKLVKFSPKIGHMIQFEAREEYHKAIEEFLSTL